MLVETTPGDKFPTKLFEVNVLSYILKPMYKSPVATSRGGYHVHYSGNTFMVYHTHTLLSAFCL